MNDPRSGEPDRDKDRDELSQSEIQRRNQHQHQIREHTVITTEEKRFCFSKNFQ